MLNIRILKLILLSEIVYIFILIFYQIINSMKSVRYDFKAVPNPSCKRNCNREARHEITSDDLCNETISVIDQLPVRCVGEWAMQKIFHLVQYFGIFSSGMKNSWGGNINYIESVCKVTYF